MYHCVYRSSYTSNPADTVAAGLLGGCDLDCGSYYPKNAQVYISNPKQPSCKKKCAALRKAMVKKDVKSKVAAKKWL